MRSIHSFFLALFVFICCIPSYSAKKNTHPLSLIPLTSINIPDNGWHLWLDKKAVKWQDEASYLPGDDDIKKMLPHPPTGGWEILSSSNSTVVTLPTTVEQHFWGADGLRPYNGTYLYDTRDKDPKNGNYVGVSWWWRTIHVPQNFAGSTYILHIRGAKQRAEVYVNQKLVGYNLIAETAFDCDISSALKLGSVNTIAIRITNSGGRLDWGDWATSRIGKTEFYEGHGFGGLDRGITLTACGAVRFNDLWVLNTPQPRTVQAHAILYNGTAKPIHGMLNATVIDSNTGYNIANVFQKCSIPANSSALVTIPVTASKAKLWDLDHPNLYKMQLNFTGGSAANREVTFGFRWFGPSGIGKNAVLRLNGKRIRIYSAISWGFWGINGLWPTPMLAEKETLTAKKLGLSAVNFHRNVARAEALDSADRLGLLRYTEPGGASTMFWKNEFLKDNTVQQYMLEKITHMVRDHRSHPSLMVYVVQNELVDDVYKNPLCEIAIRRIHEEDPSRPAILKSGLSEKGQMWMMPYDDTLYVDKGDGYSGWWDVHSVGWPDSWNDDNYKNPDDYVYRNTTTREIVDYGEMGGNGIADNHALMISQIKKLGGKSYDLIDHEEVDRAYNKFLDQYKFRSAFPSTLGLFKQIGAKQYDYWSNVLQCARLSDATDYLTVSGWETTAVENHSGIVDNLRNPHGDPQVIADALRPVMSILQPRKTAIAKGDSITYDLYFINESNKPLKGNIIVKLIDPDSKNRILAKYPIPSFQTDVFSYKVAEGLVTPQLTKSGGYILESSIGKIINRRSIHVVDIPKLTSAKVGVLGYSSNLDKDLKDIGIEASQFSKDDQYNLTVCVSGGKDGNRSQSNRPISNTDDPVLYRSQRYGNFGDMAFYVNNLPNGPAKITFGFSEDYFNSEGSRLFDVIVNGQTLLKDLDVFKLAGGNHKVWTTTVDTTVLDGKITIEPGTVKKDNAMFSTIKIEAGDKIVALYFGASPYTAKDGTVWQPYVQPIGSFSSVLDKVREGMSLLILSDNDDITTEYAEILAKEGVFKFDGLVGRSFAPWMGSWYMVRSHPLYNGLPVNTVMKGDYQVSVGQSNGMLISGKDIEVVTAYSKDHSRKIGAGDVVAPYGKGRIVFHIVPRMNDVFQKRWLANAIQFLTSHK